MPDPLVDVAPFVRKTNNSTSRTGMYFELVAELMTPLLLLCCRLLSVCGGTYHFIRLTRTRATDQIPHEVLSASSGSPVSIMAVHIMVAACGQRQGIGLMLTRALTSSFFIGLLNPTDAHSLMTETATQGARINPNVYRPLFNSHIKEKHSLVNNTNRLVQQYASAAGTEQILSRY